MAENGCTVCPVCRRGVNRRKHKSGMHKACEKLLREARKTKLRQ